MYNNSILSWEKISSEIKLTLEINDFNNIK